MVDIDEIDNDILESFYGKKQIRTFKGRQALKLELLELINEEGQNVSSLSINDNTSKFNPILNYLSQQRAVAYIAGGTGVGKTTLARKLIKYHKNVFGNDHIYIITTRQKKEENDYHSLGKYVQVDNFVYNKTAKQWADYELAKENYQKESAGLDKESKIKLRELLMDAKPKTRKAIFDINNTLRKVMNSNHSLFVFDDIEAFPKDERDMCLFLMNYICISGRSRGVSTIMIAHDITNGHTTKTILKESINYFLFRDHSDRENSYFLDKYLKLDPAQHRRLVLTPKNSRFVCIDRLNKSLVFEKKCYLY